MKTELLVVFLSSCHISWVTAPFPPCSPLIFINKLVESNSLTSDLHPYYPVPPCQYRGGTLEALSRHDLDSVFIQDLPRHIAWELAWAAGTGVPRLVSALRGQFSVKVDGDILAELTNGARSVSRQKHCHDFLTDI